MSYKNTFKLFYLKIFCGKNPNSAGVSRETLKWLFFVVKMPQNGFFFRNLHEKL
jgi:hypothetical protein